MDIDDLFPGINTSNLFEDHGHAYISYDRRSIRASIKRHVFSRRVLIHTSRILRVGIASSDSLRIDRFTGSFVCSFDVDKDYNTTRGKKRSRRQYEQESFALMTNVDAVEIILSSSDVKCH